MAIHIIEKIDISELDNGLTCIECQDLIPDFDAGLIDPELRGRVEGHISACEACDQVLWEHIALKVTQGIFNDDSVPVRSKPLLSLVGKPQEAIPQNIPHIPTEYKEERPQFSSQIDRLIDSINRLTAAVERLTFRREICMSAAIGLALAVFCSFILLGGAARRIKHQASPQLVIVGIDSSLSHNRPTLSIDTRVALAIAKHYHKLQQSSIVVDKNLKERDRLLMAVASEVHKRYLPSFTMVSRTSTKGVFSNSETPKESSIENTTRLKSQPSRKQTIFVADRYNPKQTGQEAIQVDQNDKRETESTSENSLVSYSAPCVSLSNLLFFWCFVLLTSWIICVASGIE